MELQIGIEKWLKAIPSFHVDESHTTTWYGGQVRGPSSVPVLLG